MPNRIIKESICTSDDIDRLTWFEEVMFYRLLTACDDYGRMDGRTQIIKARLFPLRDNVSKKMIEDALESMVGIGLVRRYTVSGQPYIECTNWGKHQRLRDAKAKYPEDCGELPQVAASCGELRRTAARAGAESESESNPNPNTNAASETDAHVRSVKEPKNRYGEFKNVLLTAAQYEALSGKVPGADKLIDELSMYIQSKGVKYRDHYATLLAWHRRRTETNRPHGTERNSGRKSNEGNFAGRQYTDEDWAAMYTEPPEVSE